MEKFSSHTGIAVPLRRSNVDTDQIIPAVYLKRVTRTGFEDGLFSAWRTDPGFVLNNPAYANGSILIAGPDFGTGSSREHAVWALQNYGFKVVVGARFGDIFRGNSGKSGLLVATVGQDVVEELWELAENQPGIEFSVGLVAKEIAAGERNYPFDIDDYTRYRLLEGLDDIALTLQHQDDIADYESKRPHWLPKTLPVKTADQG
jgi:3-isopropylmalate/(R)-2-methylmalate dehydratase small subunit